ncbi:MAG: SCO family protein [Pseudomonadota bacterium]|nr:SCO family protein [Pseudomonadota bacterium]
MRLRVLLLLLLLMAPSFAVAASTPDLSGIAYDQRPGIQLPIQDMFRDDTDRMVRLADLFEGKPLVLALGYFHCPNLCSVVRADLFDALRASGMMAGRDYAVGALSIDPSETSVDAAAAKADDLQRHPAPGAAQNWHYLTGTFDAVQAVANAVGFHERFDPELKQFAHPVGIVFATPTGAVSSYLLGVGYQAADVRLGVTRAAGGGIAAVASPVLLLCYDYDLATGRYTLAIMKLLRLASAITAAALAGALFIALRREKRRT